MPLTKVCAQQTRVGANRLPDGSWEFLVWAPHARTVSVHFVSGCREIIPTDPLADGYHRATIKTLTPGSEYFYKLDGERDLPDPASRFQPQGVHGPSRIVDPEAFRWTDGNAAIQADLFAGFTAPFELVLHIGATTSYLADADGQRAAA